MQLSLINCIFIEKKIICCGIYHLLTSTLIKSLPWLVFTDLLSRSLNGIELRLSFGLDRFICTKSCLKLYIFKYP